MRGVISNVMMTEGLSIVNIDAYLATMSNYAMECIAPIFEPYGIAVNHFTISAITSHDLDSLKQQSRALQEHRMETDVDAEVKKKLAQAQAFENHELGVSEQQKMVGHAMETLAGNPGPAMGAAGGMAFPGMVGGSIVQPSAAGTAEMARMLLGQQTEPQLAQDYSGTMPGGGTGMLEEAPSAPAQDLFVQRARKIKYLLDNGMISQAQYQEKLAQLMREI